MVTLANLSQLSMKIKIAALKTRGYFSKYLPFLCKCMRRPSLTLFLPPYIFLRGLNLVSTQLLACLSCLPETEKCKIEASIYLLRLFHPYLMLSKYNMGDSE